MTCRYCDRSNQDGETCRGCGAPVEPESRPSVVYDFSDFPINYVQYHSTLIGVCE